MRAFTIIAAVGLVMLASAPVLGAGKKYKEDSYEPNNSKAEAAPIGAGKIAGLACDDDDWYAITLPASCDLRVTVDCVAGNVDLVVEDANGPIAHSITDTRQEMCSCRALPVATYYVHVFGRNGTYGSYDLTVGFEGLPGPKEDSFEPNNDMTSACEVGSGTYGDLWCGDDDWYKLPLVSASDVDVSIEFDNMLGNLDFELLDASGHPVRTSETGGDGEEIRASNLPAGSYYIHVFGRSGATNIYDLVIEAAGARPGGGNGGASPAVSSVTTGTTIIYGRPRGARVLKQPYPIPPFYTYLRCYRGFGPNAFCDLYLLPGNKVTIIAERAGWYQIKIPSRRDPEWCQGALAITRASGTIGSDTPARTKPGATYPSIGIVPADTRITVSDEQNGYFRVGVLGASAWVTKSRVRLD